MSSNKSSFIEKVLGRIDTLNPENLQAFVERLVRERSFLETLFDTIEDGVLVAESEGRISYQTASIKFIPDCSYVSLFQKKYQKFTNNSEKNLDSFLNNIKTTFWQKLKSSLAFLKKLGVRSCMNRCRKYMQGE